MRLSVRAIWALTKGLWLSALVAFLASMVTCGVGGVAYWFIFGFRGTYIYYRAYVQKQQTVF